MSSQVKKITKRKASLHSVPKLYGCYLLRSIPKNKSFYIGSTPDPVRRLRQHNGELKAGAYKTKKNGYRPWEMLIFVYGFPNKISALQFEHAWQHSYQTRHIENHLRVTKSKTGGRSLDHRIGNVRLLLNSSFFKRMNLKIQLFNSLTYKAWCANKLGVKLNSDLVEIQYCDTTEQDEQINLENVTIFRNRILDEYTRLLERFKTIIKKGQHKCSFCHEGIDYITEETYPLISICYHDNCESISHLSCLGKHFRDSTTLDSTHPKQIVNKKQKIVDVPDSDLIPIKGKCISCGNGLIWTTLVRYSTLMRLELAYDGKQPELQQLDELNDEDVC